MRDVVVDAHRRSPVPLLPTSTSGLKSDVTIDFLHSDFLKDATISAIRVQLRHRIT